jgi:hypothetical protein
VSSVALISTMLMPVKSWAARVSRRGTRAPWRCFQDCDSGFDVREICTLYSKFACDFSLHVCVSSGCKMSQRRSAIPVIIWHGTAATSHERQTLRSRASERVGNRSCIILRLGIAKRALCERWIDNRCPHAVVSLAGVLPTRAQQGESQIARPISDSPRK